MHSIAHSAHKRKVGSVYKVKGDRITGKYIEVEGKPSFVGDFGVGLSLPTHWHFVPKCLTNPDTNIRGNVTTFSAASARRLRDTLLRLTIPDARRYALTATVPWRARSADGKYYTPQDLDADRSVVASFDYAPDEFRATFKRFRMAFEYRCPSSAIIWRVELQKRGAPHWHGLLYLAVDDWLNLTTDAPDCDAVSRDYILSWVLCQMWDDCIHELHGARMKPEPGHGWMLDLLNDNAAFAKYIADHSSKHKRDQLGWRGRQWGIIGKSRMVDTSQTLPEFDSPLHRRIFDRTVRRAVSYHVNAACVFGRKVKLSKRVGVRFGITRASLLRAFDYSRLLALDKMAERSMVSNDTVVSNDTYNVNINQ